ncbi:beta and beta-prime subunits of DNA dependent RNA-polymerase, partial [Pleurotus eryngii]
MFPKNLMGWTPFTEQGGIIPPLKRMRPSLKAHRERPPSKVLNIPILNFVPTPLHTKDWSSARRVRRAPVLFSGLRKVVTYWLFPNGFGICISDTIANVKTMVFITQPIASHKAEVAAVTERAIINELKTAPVMTIRESFESQYAQKNLKGDDNDKQMVVAGSKGSFINTSRVSVCVGQQSVEGDAYHSASIIVHFRKDDFSPEARGFIENSYLRGLTPYEFFHAMAGHEGLIDAAVKTDETGYIQRRLLKASEDVQARHDGTFVHGEDGIDGAFIEKQNIATFGVNLVQFKHDYHVDVVDPTGGFLLGVLQVGVDDSFLKLQAKLDEEFAQLRVDRKLLREFVFPRVVPGSAQMLGQIFDIDRRKPSDLEPAYIVDATNTTLNFSMHLRTTFASRKVLEQHHLTREAFDWVRGEVEAKFNQSIANP